MSKRLLLLVIMLVSTPTFLRAQEHADSVRHRNNCRLAEQIVSTGNPAPHEEWALSYIGACGLERYGMALASAVRRLRASEDSALLNRYWGVAVWLDDGSLLDAALDVAGDPGASILARLHAVLALRHSISTPGRRATLASLAAGECIAVSVRDDLRLTGRLRPANYEQRLRDMASKLASDPVPQMRAAAECL